MSASTRPTIAMLLACGHSSKAFRQINAKDYGRRGTDRTRAAAKRNANQTLKDEKPQGPAEGPDA